MIFLVDCNNFYVSCERLFRPELLLSPVIVLSNNDGCIISRSNEAKQLGLKMGEPVFKAKEIIKNNNVHVFSSNFELYGEISNRIMSQLKIFSNNLEVYSIVLDPLIKVPVAPNPIVESTEIIEDPAGAASSDFVNPGIVNVP